MRNLIVTEFLSLDGVMEAPGWTFPYWNDEIAQFKAEETNADQALLLGRVTYEGFAAAWPNSKDEGADYFNGARKYVVTSTLTPNTLTWNNSVAISGSVADEIRALKQEDGTDLVVHGSATLARTLLQEGLVDRVRLLVYPVLVGSGKRLFDDGITGTLRLLETRPMSSGVVGLIYEPKRA